MQLPFRAIAPKQKQLKPAGYNRFAESIVPVITILLSTMLSGIAVYVLAETQLIAVVNRTASPRDIIVVVFTLGLGLSIDTCLIVSGSRFRMHLGRGGRDWPWALVTGAMLMLCIVVEGMTSLYFVYLTSSSILPAGVVDTIANIHNILFFVRGFIPPITLFFFTALLLPLSIEPADRDRLTAATLSRNLADLQSALTVVGPTATYEDIVRAYITQTILFEHAHNSSDAEKKRNAALIADLRLIAQERKQATNPVTAVQVSEEAQSKVSERLSRVNPDVRTLSPALDEILSRSGA